MPFHNRFVIYSIIGIEFAIFALFKSEGSCSTWGIPLGYLTGRVGDPTTHGWRLLSGWILLGF